MSLVVGRAGLVGNRTRRGVVVVDVFQVLGVGQIVHIGYVRPGARDADNRRGLLFGWRLFLGFEVGSGFGVRFEVVVGLGSEIGLVGDLRLVRLGRRAVVEIDFLARITRTFAPNVCVGATMPPVIATVSPPIPTNHRNTAGPKVAWSTPTWPKLPNWPPPA